MVACGENERSPISATTMALTTQGNIEQVLRGAHQAGSFIAKSATLASLLSSSVTETCTSTKTGPCLPGTVCPEPKTVCETTTENVTTADLEEGRQDISDGIDDLLQWLRDDLLIPENLESEDGQAAIYRVPAALLCKSEDSTPVMAPPTIGKDPVIATAPELDPECVETVTKLSPRLALTSPGDGAIDVAILLTAGKRHPVTFKLRAESASVVFDLTEIKAAFVAVGEDTEEVAAMTGQLAFEIHRHADLDYSLRLNVMTRLGLTIIDDLAEEIIYQLAPHTPTFEVRLDGVNRRMIGTVHLGRFEVSGALNAFRDFFEEESALDRPNPSPVKKYTGLIHLLVGGLGGSMVLEGQTDRIEMKSLGLGDVSSTLQHDGNVIAKLDLNPKNGRHFDLSVERTADDHAQLTFLPALDLTFIANFATLQNQITDIPAVFLGDTIRLFLGGANPSVVIEPKQVRVQSGTLSLTSTRVPDASLQATAGMCLVDSETTSTAHEWLDEIDVAICK
jgi:hypothetical protein